MSEQLHTMTDPHLLAAMDANFVEEMACFGRNLPGATLGGDEELLWFATDRAGFNGVLRCHIQSDDTETIKAKIAAVQHYFRERNVGIGWFVGPTTRPTNLASYLIAQGFTYQRTNTGMVLNIASMRETTASPASLSIQEITDTVALQRWRTVSTRGWGSSEAAGQAYYDTYAYTGFGPGAPWHHYLGWQHDQPVAIASLLLHAGVAGMYGIVTLPEARKQGIGTAMTRHALHAARSLDYKVAVLSPTEMGANIYHRIGFQEICTFDLYRWSPS